MENKLDLCQQCSPAATTPTSHGIALASGQQVQGCGYSLLPGSGEAASAILCAVFKHTHPIVWEMLAFWRGSNTAQGSVRRSMCHGRRCNGNQVGSHCRVTAAKGRDKNSKARIPSFSCKCTVTGQQAVVSCCQPGKSFFNKGSILFTMRVLQPWDRLPKEVVESPSLGFPGYMWTRPWSDFIQLGSQPCLEQEMGFQCTFFMDSAELTNLAGSKLHSAV